MNNSFTRILAFSVLLLTAPITHAMEQGSPVQSHRFVPYKKMGTMIGDVIDILAGKQAAGQMTIEGTQAEVTIQDFMEHIKLVTVDVPGVNTYQFFGVHVDQEANVNFAEFKQKVMEHVRTPGFPTVQLIGDSNQFSQPATQFARKFLEREFAGAKLIENGYTGHQSDGRELDVNSLLNEYVDRDPAQAQRVIANVLGHTETAINKWGCYVSPCITNFVVVYNDYGMDDKMRTHFGDDVIISDNFLRPECGDYVICLDGGIQSFLQVCNSLLVGVPVKFVYNMRKADNHPPREAGRKPHFFSTAEFFATLAKSFEGRNVPTEETVRALYEEYAQTHEAWDPTRPDAETKAGLFDKAMDKLFNQGAYENLQLCEFIDCTK